MASASSNSSPSENLIPVVRHADALTDASDLHGGFDVVIGNPPWRERPDRLAQRFTEKTPDFLRAGGMGCLLLPTSLLLNRTDDFQAKWLRRITLERIVNLADYRLILFQNAKRPALIARFRNNPPQPGMATVEHDAPKFRRDSLREGCITISPTDRSWIPIRNILAAAQEKTAPMLWKRHLWGTPRDQKLLNLLQDMPELSEVAGEPDENQRWIKGQGFQPNTSGKSKEPKQAWWTPSHLFISARADNWSAGGLVLLMKDCEPIGQRFKSLHRPRDPRIYVPPMVLVSKGFGKVAFCDFPVLFQHSIQSIAGPHEDEALLMFLAAYLRSPLARYFLFHTAGNWGTERDEVQLDELMRLPFPLPGSEYVDSKGDRIVRDVAKRVREFRNKIEESSHPNSRLLKDQASNEERKSLTDSLQIELNQLVYKYFGLTQQEIILIEDTAEVSIPSSTPHNWWSTNKVFTLDPIQSARPTCYRAGISVYADTLTQTLNSWADDTVSPLRMVATGGYDSATSLAMVTLRLAEKPSDFQPVDVSKALWEALEIFRRKAARKNEGALATERDIVLFHGKSIHIVRPGILANWTRTAALNDAAKIYGEIALAGENK